MSYGEELYEGVEHLEEAGSNALLIFCLAMGLPFEEISQIVRVDENGEPPWATLMSPNKTPERFLPWLSQFAGIDPIKGESAESLRKRLRCGMNPLMGTYVRGNAKVLHKLLVDNGAPTTLIQERFEGHAYRIRFLFTAEEYTEAIYDLVKRNLPAGIKPYLEYWNGILYDSYPEIETYDDAAAEFTDYDEAKGS